VSFSKLRRIHVVIIGCAVIVVVGVGMYFLLITKAQKRLTDETNRYNQYAQTGTIEYVNAQKADFEHALQEVAAQEAKLNAYFNAKMPYLDFRDRKQGMIALWQEQSLNLGPLIINWIANSGVRFESANSIRIPAPPANPNELSSDPLAPITIPLGRIRVTGSFNQILAHLAKWNSCKRLVMIDNPSLSGTSPNLTCEYDATVYIFPRYPAGPVVEMAGASTSAGTMGVPGMPGGGMPPTGGGGSAVGPPAQAPTPPPSGQR